ncbi:MAG: LytR C-terminal domain-containing protein [Aeriscardovia sp.]|nr:LytR C-terminal domain-containing protein [Aeriscardovia sp.]
MASSSKGDSGFCDEFETPPTGPVGAHRGPKSRWRRFLPYFVALCVALAFGLGAWGVWTEVGIRNSQHGAEALQPMGSPVDKGTVVIVYNATEVSGLAGQNRTTLKNQGFSNVLAQDWPDSQAPSSNVVWYNGADNENTANQVASDLGISQVVEQSYPLNAPIEAIFVTP